MMRLCIYFRGGYTRRELRYFYRFEAPIVVLAAGMAVAGIHPAATAAGGFYALARAVTMACAYAAAPEVE